MWLLCAPEKQFGKLPPRTPLLTQELQFTNNVALCTKKYWRDLALQRKIIDVSPKWLIKQRKDRTMHTIIINARGGIGDVMWSLPIIKALRKKYNQAAIHVVTETNRIPIFLGNPFINSFAAPPIDTLSHIFFTASEVYDMGGVATFLPGWDKKHVIDNCFEKADLPLPKDTKDKRPYLILTHEEGRAAENYLTNQGIIPRRDKIVTFGMESSTPNRNWPLSRIIKLSKRFLDEGYKIVWMGQNREFKNTTAYLCMCGYYLEIQTEQNPGSITFKCPNCKGTHEVSIKSKIPGIANMVAEADLRTAMAIIALSDCFIGPDSGLLNIAGALETPCVGLFGPIKADLRMKYFTKWRSVQGEAPCTPCFEHWTECRHGYPSPCMMDIKIETVYKTAKEVLNKYPRPKGDEKLPVQ